MNSRHGRWVEFLQDYTYVFRHKAEVENRVAYALSRRRALLSVMSTEMVGFENIKDTYESCPNFENIYTVLRDSLTHEIDGFLLQDGYLFHSRLLCIPRISLREFLVRELHAGGLTGHFGRNKTIEAVEHHFYWPSLKRDVARLVSQGQYRTCQLTKQQK